MMNLLAFIAIGSGMYFYLGLPLFIFWIWTIIEVATKESAEGNTKIVWLIIVIFTYFIGSLLYYFIRRPERKKLLGR